MAKTPLVLLVLLGAVCLVGAGCSKKKNDAGQKKDETTQAGEAPARPDKRPPIKRPPPVHRVMLPITADEARPLLPQPDGTRVVKEVQKVQVGERVEAAFCADTGEPLAIAEGVKAKLEGAGWTLVTTRPHPTLKERVGVHAKKEPYELTGFVQRGAAGQWAECVGDKGQTYVNLFVFKVEQRKVEGGAPGPGPMLGPGGGPMRPGALGPRVVLPPGARPVAPGATQPGQPPQAGQPGSATLQPAPAGTP